MLSIHTSGTLPPTRSYLPVLRPMLERFITLGDQAIVGEMRQVVAPLQDGQDLTPDTICAIQGLVERVLRGRFYLEDKEKAVRTFLLIPNIRSKECVRMVFNLPENRKEILSVMLERGHAHLPNILSYISTLDPQEQSRLMEHILGCCKKIPYKHLPIQQLIETFKVIEDGEGRALYAFFELLLEKSDLSQASVDMFFRHFQQEVDKNVGYFKRATVHLLEALSLNQRLHGVHLEALLRMCQTDPFSLFYDCCKKLVRTMSAEGLQALFLFLAKNGDNDR